MLDGIAFNSRSVLEAFSVVATGTAASRSCVILTSIFIKTVFHGKWFDSEHCYQEQMSLVLQILCEIFISWIGNCDDTANKMPVVGIVDK
ncbi:hypothetical protein QQP08_020247 [Theobroma cacao]|nr:hypothetical protein QQP08_020247 [Theobroma cacao]